METISEIKTIIRRSDVLSVLSESVYMPTPERLKELAESYGNNLNVNVFGYIINEKIAGLIVVDGACAPGISNEITILNFAVQKENQRKGIGRKLIHYLLEKYNPQVIIAETDDEAVLFYQKCGFQVTSLGEKYPGIIRYDCKYINQLSESVK